MYIIMYELYLILLTLRTSYKYLDILYCLADFILKISHSQNLLIHRILLYTLTHYLADFINLLNFSHFYLNFELTLRLVPKINVSHFFHHSNQIDS